MTLSFSRKISTDTDFLKPRNMKETIQNALNIFIDKFRIISKRHYKNKKKSVIQDAGIVELNR